MPSCSFGLPGSPHAYKSGQLSTTSRADIKSELPHLPVVETRSRGSPATRAPTHWYVDTEATVALITKAFDALKADRKIGRSTVRCGP